jgi:hypothetical protein
MEPRQEKPKTTKPRTAEKPKRFRIVKLEERIAPSKGGNGTNNCPSVGLTRCYSLCTCGTGTASIE